MTMNYVAVATSARSAALAAYDAEKYDDALVREFEYDNAHWQDVCMSENADAYFFEFELPALEMHLREIATQIEADPSNESLIDLYSDMYKDVYGVRPHWRVEKWRLQAARA